MSEQRAGEQTERAQCECMHHSTTELKLIFKNRTQLLYTTRTRDWDYPYRDGNGCRWCCLRWRLHNTRAHTHTHSHTLCEIFSFSLQLTHTQILDTEFQIRVFIVGIGVVRFQFYIGVSALFFICFSFWINFNLLSPTHSSCSAVFRNLYEKT